MISDEVRQNWPVAVTLEDRDPSWITGGVVHAGQLTVYVNVASIASICRFLKDNGWRLSGITATDWHPLEPRFEVVYLLHSISEKQRIRLKCKLHGDAPEIDSVTGVSRVFHDVKLPSGGKDYQGDDLSNAAINRRDS